MLTLTIFNNTTIDLREIRVRAASVASDDIFRNRLYVQSLIFDLSD